MKPYSVLLAAALISGFAHVRAQDAAMPAVSAPPGVNPPVEAANPQLLQTPALLPPSPAQREATPAPVAPSVPPVLKKGTAEQLRQAIQIRELKTQVLEDPEVQAQKTLADCTKTPEGQRVLMRNYYTLLYTKMEGIDPSLKPVLERQLHDTLASYEQRNVRPSVLVESVAALPGSDSADHGDSSAPVKPAKLPKKSSKKR